jgi:hypothetical protein
MPSNISTLLLSLRLLILLGSCGLISVSHGAELVTIRSVNSDSFREFEKTIDSSSLLIINVDNTLITPESKLFRYQNNIYRHTIQNLWHKTSEIPSVSRGLKDFLQRRKVRLIEPELKEFVKRAIDRAGFAVALYHSHLPERDLIPNPEERLYLELSELGISFPFRINHQDIVILKNDSKNIKSTFYKGILFAGTANKGDALGELLKILPIALKKVIVIDNDLNDLKNIKKALRFYNVAFYPVLYLAERDIVGTPDKKTVELQERMLITQGKWLEDSEAETLLRSEP